MFQLPESHSLHDLRPDLAKEWHPTKNGSLGPRDITLSSTREIWWLCENGHWWLASVRDRTRGKKCTRCRDLIKRGDQRMVDLRPELLKEWHPTHNPGVSVRDVPSNYNRRVWWLCEHGHEWAAGVPCRISGKGCPVCKSIMPRSGFIKSPGNRPISPQAGNKGESLTDFAFSETTVPPYGGQELRKTRRYEHSGTVMVEKFRSEIIGYAQLRNFSATGMMLQADFGIIQGEINTIRLDKPLYPSSPNVMTTKVVWCQDLESQSETDSRYGIGFIFL